MSRIYVASLLDYNCGTLHGAWFDVDCIDAVSLGAEIQLMLDKSPHAAMGDGIAEEFAIHDHEGFGGFDLGEYAGLEFVVRLAELVEEHGEAFAVFVENVWGCGAATTIDDIETAESAFIDAWIGNMTAEDYAYEYVTECLDITGIAFEYFDFERFANDMVMGGEITEYNESGEVYLFRNN